MTREEPKRTFFRPPSSKAEVFGLVIRLLLAGIFLMSGYAKIADPDSFARALHDMQLPLLAEDGFLSGLVTRYLPWCEVFLSVFLLLGIAVRGNSRP